MQKHKQIKQNMLVMNIKDLIELVETKQLQYREPNQYRVRLFKKYIENNIEGNIYIPPLIVNSSIQSSLLNDPVLTVIDGSVRIKAICQLRQLVKEKLSSEEVEEIWIGEKIRDFIDEGYVSIQSFEGLSTDTVNQLYIDFNTKGKKVALSKLISYDSRSEINRITNDVLEQNENLQRAGVEMEKRAVIKPVNENLLSLSQLRKLIAVFIKEDLLIKIPKGPIDSNLTKDEHVELVTRWFDSLFKLEDPYTIGMYNKNILSSFPLLHALAYYAIKDTSQMTFSEKMNEIETRMSALSIIDFSTTNPIWSTFNSRKSVKDDFTILENSQKNIQNLATWLETQSRKGVNFM
ncbi:hypothetical protein JCM9140_3763 [Halalkalibacter wakoensis JCM 9140]|uniref:Uncharacterized protein n=1 Tax=Halalkalibacter wakoensis JCM 9140 TaxID=1236970 RepID=W4Q6M1_9BACI|nr:DNA sulfur modification protein DndB [Halalkalibacter wakoensis]GAE27610.1 hypothetical protein JCM9140_3763 [Halalkalibacter wakoensis JCM 9140]